MADKTPPEAENLGVPEPTDDGAEPAQAGGGGKKIVVLAAVLVALVGGAGVAFSQFGAIDRTAQSLFGPSGEAEEDAPIEYGEFMQIDGLVVNPAGTGGSRYLMVSLGLEAADAAVLGRSG